MTITEKELAEKLESISALMLGLDKKEAWTRVAREAAELMGYEFTPEKPEPGTWHIVKDGPQVGDAARVDEDGYLHVIGSNGKTLRDIHPDNTWPELTPARIVPVATTPVTLTEDQVGEEWDEHRVDVTSPWRSWGVAPRMSVTRTVNAALTQHAAPAEDIPDWDDVRNAVASERGNGWSLNDAAINGITDAVMRLLHREEA